MGFFALIWTKLRFGIDRSNASFYNPKKGSEVYGIYDNEFQPERGAGI